MNKKNEATNAADDQKDQQATDATTPNIRYVGEWVILKIEFEKVTRYRLLCTDESAFFIHWRLNSGIAAFEVKKDIVDFHGFSGSCYRCKIENERISPASMSVLEEIAAPINRANGKLYVIRLKDFLKEWVDHVPRRN